MEAQVAPVGHAVNPTGKVGGQSTIGSLVGRLIAVHRLRTPYPATRLYVGELEWAALEELVRGLDTGLFSTEQRAYFMGLRVHRVLEPEHLRVC